MTKLHLSPLDGDHRALGAKMVEFGGWDMPVAYPSGTISEHLACRRDAVVFDVSHLGTVCVEGFYAKAALQGVLTNDLNKISVGRAQYTHLLNDAGCVLDDIIVWWVSDDRFDVMPNASNTDHVLSAIGGVDVTQSRNLKFVKLIGGVRNALSQELATQVNKVSKSLYRFRMQAIYGMRLLELV
jgi:aminomethyltransferase